MGGGRRKIAIIGVGSLGAEHTASARADPFERLAWWLRGRNKRQRARVQRRRAARNRSIQAPGTRAAGGRWERSRAAMRRWSQGAQRTQMCLVDLDTLHEEKRHCFAPTPHPPLAPFPRRCRCQPQRPVAAVLAERSAEPSALRCGGEATSSRCAQTTGT